MKIDQLPVEMLMKIFSYLPTYDEVSLVNKLEFLDLYGLTRLEDRFLKKSSGNGDLNLSSRGSAIQLELVSCYWFVLTDVLQRQTNIKKLKCDRIEDYGPMAADIFDNLQLEALEFVFCFFVEIPTSVLSSVEAL